MNMTKNQLNKHENRKDISLKLFKIFPFLVLLRESFFSEVCTIKRIIFSLLLMILPPLITLIVFPKELFAINLSLIQSPITIVLLIYTYGFLFPLIITTTISPLIVREVNSKTIYSLISKPLNRIEIITGKFIAAFIFGILINTITLLAIIIYAWILLPFIDLQYFFIVNFIHGIFVIVIFGGLAMGVSCIVKKPRQATLIPVIIIMIFFYFFPSITAYLNISSMYGSESLYKNFQVYQFDLSYQMANIYKSIADFFVPGAISAEAFGPILYTLNIFTFGNTYTCYEYGCVAGVIGYVETSYYLPEISLLYMLLIGLLPMSLGSIKFIKRDFY